MTVYYDHRMVEGSPLQYRYEVASSPIDSSFPFFSRFELGRRPMMSEELLVPNSPNSTQSDSENSISSIDVIPEPIHRSKIANNPLTGKKTDAQCCWRSCGIVFQSLDQLSDHVSKAHATSGLGGLYYCGWEGCARNNKGFNARYKMLVHVRTHTNEKPHQCAQCQKSFSRAENLKIHSRSHSGEKPYACPVPGCTKAYSNSSDRFKHTRTHQVDKPYQCKVAGCPKRYTDPSSLRKHVKTYKHFVGENNRANGDESTLTADVETTNHPIDASQQNQPCTCNHSCQLAKSLDALINFRGDDIKPWNNVIERRIYLTYDLNEHMDVDLPLDLSVARKHI